MKKIDNRPQFLNLLKIRLPITGIVSINHRISGLLLFLAMPFSLYLFQLSLSSEEGYAQMLECISSTWFKLLLVIMLWSFLHHLLAGFRFLLIDLTIGINLPAARKSSWFVIVAAIVLTLVFVGWGL
ncbi:MAG: succinate dehydrogenase, cytochrome b556 subunit [Woeseiaceae bacterium]